MSLPICQLHIYIWIDDCYQVTLLANTYMIHHMYACPTNQVHIQNMQMLDHVVLTVSLIVTLTGLRL